MKGERYPHSLRHDDGVSRCQRESVTSLTFTLSPPRRACDVSSKKLRLRLRYGFAFRDHESNDSRRHASEVTDARRQASNARTPLAAGRRDPGGQLRASTRTPQKSTHTQHKDTQRGDFVNPVLGLRPSRSHAHEKWPLGVTASESLESRLSSRRAGLLSGCVGRCLPLRVFLSYQPCRRVQISTDYWKPKADFSLRWGL